MPAGVSWLQYTKIMGASLISMFAGAQCVHVIYKPLKDFDVIVDKEKERLRQEVDLKSSKTE